MKKSILLTNYEMSNFAGSELDTISIANYFIDRGYDVSIFTLYYDYPLKEKIDNNDIKVITLDNIDEIRSNYDLIWAHHYPLLDYLIFYCNVSAKKIVHASLSSILGIEAVPDYWKNLTLLLANSEATKKAVIEQGVRPEKVTVFPNYAPKKYFDKKINLSKTLKRMCVISNHVPQEVKDTIKIIEATGTKVDIFGMEYESVVIDEELLEKYDLIISIGKTVNYCIALGIPIYCYDVFGGPGYINEKNYKQALDFHFSGKTFDRKLSAEELAKDIIKNYSNAIKSVKGIRKYAYDDFCFEDNMQKVLSVINNSEDINMQNLCKEYPQLFKKSQTFIYFYKSLASYRHVLKETQNQLTYQIKKLNSIHNSKGYKLLKVFYYSKEKTIPWLYNKK